MLCHFDVKVLQTYIIIKYIADPEQCFRKACCGLVFHKPKPYSLEMLTELITLIARP